MNSTAHILVVEDDPDTGTMLRLMLERADFAVSVVRDGVSMRAHLERTATDLVLMDLMLAGEDGLSLVRWLRSNLSPGIIIVTAKSDMLDRVVGLEVGADDYVVKPFDRRELLARIRQVLWRRQKAGRDAPSRQAVCFAGWRLDLLSRQLVSPQGREVPLTTAEFDLLAQFVRNPNRVLSRDDLLRALRHRQASPMDRSIDIQVGRLRRKIEAQPQEPELVRTVRGAGYVFTPPVELN